ncbi:GNAT family N-acetyltransferase [Yoonia sp.]|uniref:GNAT family N-acetyltransferase n=1 Tax=Yoonia sp. TaxID=2212373 RepID=UPI002FDA6BA4
MTIPFTAGCLSARLAETPADILACQRLRQRCFFGTEGLDQDRFDLRCKHLMVLDGHGALVATARVMLFASGAEIEASYAAQYYDLAGLATQRTPIMEVGRFCIAPTAQGADVLRLAWAVLTHLVDKAGATVLFGCTSFQGIDPQPYGAGFTRLFQRYQSPADLRPRARAKEVIPFATMTDTGSAPLPPLLRTYLAMGGWVSDHAVVDRAMNTLHVFTCVSLDQIPPARARALRALAQGIAVA